MGLMPEFYTRSLMFHPAPAINKVHPIDRMISAEIEVAGLRSCSRNHTSPDIPRVPDDEPTCRNCSRFQRAYGRMGTCACDPASPHSWRRPDFIPWSTFRVAHYNLIADWYPAQCDCTDALTAALDKWSISCVSDGSLPDEGFELNTAPAGGDKLHTQITEVCGALNDLDAETTSECGCHIHADARDIDWYGMRRVALVYSYLEPLLFSMVSSRRRESSYCRECGYVLRQWFTAPDPRKIHDTKKNVLRRLYGFDTDAYQKTVPGYDKHLMAQTHKRHVQTLRSGKDHKYNEARYNALNVHSWLHRGSLEWRMPSGTTNATVILGWASVFALMLNHAVSAREKDVKDLAATYPHSRKHYMRNQILSGHPAALAFFNRRVSAYGSGE